MRSISIMIISIVLLGLLTGCHLNGTNRRALGVVEDSLESTKTQQLSQPPVLTVEYEGKYYTAVKGTYSWSANQNDIEADSECPIELVKYQKQIIAVKSGDTFDINFTTEPMSYTIQIWHDFDDMEPVTSNEEGQIIVPDFSASIVYEVHGIWDQGNAYYAFELQKYNVD